MTASVGGNFSVIPADRQTWSRDESILFVLSSVPKSATIFWTFFTNNTPSPYIETKSDFGVNYFDVRGFRANNVVKIVIFVKGNENHICDVKIKGSNPQFFINVN